MGTTKLGLKIVKSYAGFSEGFGVNENPAWIKSVRDTRDDCKYVIGLDEDCDTSVIMYSATRVGEFYTIVSMIAGRHTDFISAWIYCPLDIEISGEEMSRIVDATRQEILANEVNQDKLVRIFSKEYPQVCIPKACTSTEGTQYAVRYYGADTFYGSLSELLGSNMAQPENRRYKGIFLIDSKSSLKANADCINISKTILKESFILEAPKECLGYTPYYNGKPFTSPIRLTKGDKISVVWKKEGFKDVPTETIVDSPETKVKAVTEADERVIIRLDDFEIRNEGEIIDKEDLKIRVGNTEINFRQNASVHVSNLANSEVSVSGEGFKPFRENVDLRNKPVLIKLKTDSYIYQCRIPLELEDGVKAKCTAKIESNRRFEHTPIKGYHSRQGFYYTDGIIDLYYEEPKNNKKTLIFAAIALVAGLLIGATAVGYLSHSRIKDLENQIQVTQSEQNAKAEEKRQKEQAKRSVSAAVKYLDEHPKWVKSEMQEYDRLKGLWDELNNLNYDAILMRSELRGNNGSSIFTELCTQIEALLAAGKNINGPICTAVGDETITIRSITDKMRNKANEVSQKPAAKPSDTNKTKEEEQGQSKKAKFGQM